MNRENKFMNQNVNDDSDSSENLIMNNTELSMSKAACLTAVRKKMSIPSRNDSFYRNASTSSNKDLHLTFTRARTSVFTPCASNLASNFSSTMTYPSKTQQKLKQH